jgi:ParB-like chromosome segregation protein Spo0J
MLESSIGLPGPPEGFRSQSPQVVRSPGELRLHPAVLRLNLASPLVGTPGGGTLEKQSVVEPILITTNSTIISGFSSWQSALRAGCTRVQCIEYSLSDEDALRFILLRNRPQRSWNSFSRIRLALELEPHFQAKATANQIHGGKYKGSANLPKAGHVEARREVARLAGVGARSVTSVKTILDTAHQRLIDALQNENLSIHRGVQLCNLPRAQQVEQFIADEQERTAHKVTRRAMRELARQAREPEIGFVLKVLQEHEMREPGSIVVRAGGRQQTVILLGGDILADLKSKVESAIT